MKKSMPPLLSYLGNTVPLLTLASSLCIGLAGTVFTTYIALISERSADVTSQNFETHIQSVEKKTQPRSLSESDIEKIAPALKPYASQIGMVSLAGRGGGDVAHFMGDFIKLFEAAGWRYDIFGSMPMSAPQSAIEICYGRPEGAAAAEALANALNDVQNLDAMARQEINGNGTLLAVYINPKP